VGFLPIDAVGFIAGGPFIATLIVIPLTQGWAGLRELGRRWSDIDLAAGTLRIARQLQRMRRVDGEPGKLEFSEPKNASRRTVDLPQRSLRWCQSGVKRGRAGSRSVLVSVYDMISHLS
jgi:hypothetical protein